MRSHPAVVRWHVPVNIEADSLNVAILGPDVEPDTDTFQRFIRDVVLEMTQKAGQKFTAVRRIFIPRGREDVVREALNEGLEDAHVGDPTARGVQVGPLATRAQQEHVARGVAALESTTTLWWRSSATLPAHGFYSTLTLFFTDAGERATFVHEHEVFGPVAPVLSWSGDVDEAATLALCGGGGLVASVYSDDGAWAGRMVLELAPWHGRVLCTSRKVVDQATPSGLVLPGLVHGGPGKAGGGEELGGLRGLEFYMQRTAVQGDRGLLQKLMGRSDVLGNG